MSGTILLLLRAIMALCLYAFVGWALYSLWQDLKQTTGILSKRELVALHLTHQHEDGNIELAISAAEFTIGRDPACEYSIEDGTVSAQHARLAYRQGQWWVEDLHSKNGTYLNQERVGVPTVLVAGDELRCGQACFTVSFPGAEETEIAGNNSLI